MELDPWSQSFLGAMSALWQPVAAFIPRLFGALLLVAIGFVVAKLLDTLLSKLLAKIGLDRLVAGTGATKLLGRAGIRMPISVLLGKIVYWFVLLIFLVSVMVPSCCHTESRESRAPHCPVRRSGAKQWVDETLTCVDHDTGFKSRGRIVVLEGEQ